MVPGPDHFGAPGSFTARRPNASSLPNFELPPPPLAGLHQKYQQHPSFSSTHAAPATTLTSVGNLLTPPSNGSTDGISPITSSLNTASNNQSAFPPFTPSTGMFSQSNNSTYGYQSNSASQPPFGQGRSLFSPSLNSIMRSNHSSTATESLPPPPYELPQYQTSSVPMPAPGLPAMSHQSSQHMGMMGIQTPVSASSVTQPSPVNTQDAFSRPPPTPSYHQQQHSAPPSANPHHGHFSYSTGPSPVQQSPHAYSAGGAMKMSPVNGQGPVPSLQQYPQPYSRPNTYPLPGPVLSNVNNPGGHMQMMNGVHHSMGPGFNSGHAAQMQQMYGHHAQQPSPQNDRPFRCDQCPQSFNRNHDLKRHKRIHLAVKPFPCGHCDKSFSRKDALKRHVLVKGCGKAHATAEVKEIESSISPISKSEGLDPASA